MSGAEILAESILRKAIDFLFDQASKIMEERRMTRQRKEEKIDPRTNVTENSPTKRDILSRNPKNLYLNDYSQEIRHCMDMIERYRHNKRQIEETIAHYGSLSLTPTHVKNELKDTEEAIGHWIKRLKQTIEEVYGCRITIVGIDENL